MGLLDPIDDVNEDEGEPDVDVTIVSEVDVSIICDELVWV